MKNLLFAVGFCLAGSSMADGPAYNGFTEPIRTIELAIPESGRVSAVDVAIGDAVAVDDPVVRLEDDMLRAALKIAEARCGDTARRESLEVSVQRAGRLHQRLNELAGDGAGNPEELREASAKLRIAELALQTFDAEHRVEQLKAEQVRRDLERRIIRSPIRGVVVDVAVEVGEYVSTVEPRVATIVDLRQLRVTFFVRTEIARQIRPGAKIRLRMDGDDAAAIVRYVEPVTRAASGRVRIDVVIDNADHAYRAGVNAETHFEPADAPETQS